jgi:hypothetical protein
MVCESTFIFPKGLKPERRQQGGEAGAGAEQDEVMGEEDWDQELGQETMLVPTSKTRETISAPGPFGLTSSKGEALTITIFWAETVHIENSNYIWYSQVANGLQDVSIRGSLLSICLLELPLR